MDDFDHLRLTHNVLFQFFTIFYRDPYHAHRVLEPLELAIEKEAQKREEEEGNSTEVVREQINDLMEKHVDQFIGIMRLPHMRNFLESVIRSPDGEIDPELIRQVQESLDLNNEDDSEDDLHDNLDALDDLVEHDPEDDSEDSEDDYYDSEEDY